MAGLIWWVSPPIGGWTDKEPINPPCPPTPDADADIAADELIAMFVVGVLIELGRLAWM